MAKTRIGTSFLTGNSVVDKLVNDPEHEIIWRDGAQLKHVSQASIGNYGAEGGGAVVFTVVEWYPNWDDASDRFKELDRGRSQDIPLSSYPFVI